MDSRLPMHVHSLHHEVHLLNDCRSRPVYLVVAVAKGTAWGHARLASPLMQALSLQVHDRVRVLPTNVPAKQPPKSLQSLVLHPVLTSDAGQASQSSNVPALQAGAAPPQSHRGQQAGSTQNIPAMANGYTGARLPDTARQQDNAAGANAEMQQLVYVWMVGQAQALMPTGLDSHNGKPHSISVLDSDGEEEQHTGSLLHNTNAHQRPTLDAGNNGKGKHEAAEQHRLPLQDGQVLDFTAASPVQAQGQHQKANKKQQQQQTQPSRQQLQQQQQQQQHQQHQSVPEPQQGPSGRYLLRLQRKPTLHTRAQTSICWLSASDLLHGAVSVSLGEPVEQPNPTTEEAQSDSAALHEQAEAASELGQQHLTAVGLQGTQQHGVNGEDVALVQGQQSIVPQEQTLRSFLHGSEAMQAAATALLQRLLPQLAWQSRAALQTAQVMQHC